MEDKEFCTESVISFLRDNPEILKKYFSMLDKSHPSYSDMLGVMSLSGTTKEQVNFTSSRVARSKVTKFLIGEYKNMLGGK